MIVNKCLASPSVTFVLSFFGGSSQGTFRGDSPVHMKLLTLAHEIAVIFAICDCDAHRGPQKSLAISETCIAI